MSTQAQILDTSLLVWDKEAACGQYDVPADLTWGTIRLGGDAVLRKAEVLINLTERFPAVQAVLTHDADYQEGVDLARELTGRDRKATS
ncbi:hypothetical protein [Actinoplanes sp. N902-109]|uniref:hypothetical protein n=1 Tax=Actinoplanes sp. (strain N902-109) TaxID=649831 RepID=UPI00032963E1|nr:hypothetical protein [Actinoplanes sp. N902-109]AGL15216.1 hypothetical protein L083_1706 [Actinoplanes sp. N902-109]